MADKTYIEFAPGQSLESQPGFDLKQSITFAARVRVSPNGRKRQTITRVGPDGSENAVELLLDEKNDLVLQQGRHSVSIPADHTSCLVGKWGSVCFRVIPNDGKVRLELELSDGTTATDSFPLQGNTTLKTQTLGGADGQFDMGRVMSISRVLTEAEDKQNQQWLAAGDPS